MIIDTDLKFGAIVAELHLLRTYFSKSKTLLFKTLALNISVNIVSIRKKKKLMSHWMDLCETQSNHWFCIYI